MNTKYLMKKAYGLECLCFDASKKMISCKYVGDRPDLEDNINISDLDWLLKVLSVQQGIVYFEDVGKQCVGIDEIKYNYLTLRLSGL